MKVGDLVLLNGFLCIILRISFAGYLRRRRDYRLFCFANSRFYTTDSRYTVPVHGDI